MSTLALLLAQVVDALSQAALLFFLGVDLTLIFGLMRIVNFAHGALLTVAMFAALCEIVSVGDGLFASRPSSSIFFWSSGLTWPARPEPPYPPKPPRPIPL